MSAMTRRAFASGLAGVGALVFGGKWVLDRRNPAKQISDLLGAEFGEHIVESEAGQEFVLEMARRTEIPPRTSFLDFSEIELDGHAVVTGFIHATNVVRSLETGEELIFVGIGSPIELPCTNTLSADWL